MSNSPAIDPSRDRVQSIDQFRGYAIFGMMLVNFFGHYSTKWVDALSIEGLKDPLKFIFGEQLHHHNHYMTYADTIAPTNSPHPTVNSQTTLKTVFWSVGSDWRTKLMTEAK